MSRPFVLNDESVINDRGFILLNAGIDTKRFLANPVMLDLHDLTKVAGKWTNLRTEGSKLMADPEFDQADEDAKKLEGKVDRGFIKGASMWITPLEAELQAIPDKGLIPVVTKSELMEASIVAVPSNALALRLSSGKNLTTNEEIKLAIDQIIINKTETMTKIILSAAAAQALAVNTETDDTALNSAVLKLSADLTVAKAAETTALTAKKTAEDALTAFTDARATALVEGAITAGRLTADKKESFLKLAKEDFKQATDLIGTMPAKETLSDHIKLKVTASEDRSTWDYMKWAKEDPKGLRKLSAEHPDEFEALKKSYQPKN